VELGCVGRNSFFVLGGIRLSGLPGHPAGWSSGQFGLAPHETGIFNPSTAIVRTFLSIIHILQEGEFLSRS